MDPDSNNPTAQPVRRSFRERWWGVSKIILGIDVGTTYSSVGFTYAYRDAELMLHRVDKWPGQQYPRGKVPSVVWYNIEGEAMSFGAEALAPEIRYDAEDNGWQLAKHFKLHLHPPSLRSKHKITIEELPFSVSLKQIYSDFFGYLLRCTKKFFEERIVDGQTIWKNYSSSMVIVITHPNGWGTREEAFLRSAVVSAGFVTPNQAPSQVRFVTEAEALVHFCFLHTNLGGVLQPGMDFAVCDDGGSTVNTSLYSVVSTQPVLRLAEKRASAYVQASTVFVDAALERFLRNAFTATGIDEEDAEEYIRSGVKDFGDLAKRGFTDETTDLLIQIGSGRFNNPSIRVRRGRMTISGSIIKGFLDTCIKDITASVDQQINGFSVRHILLTGELSNIPYFRRVFQNRYESRGYQVAFVDDYLSPTIIADGAILWSSRATIISRCLRLSWGIETLVALSDDDPDHRDRKIKSSASGQTVIPGRWHCLVRKGLVVAEDFVVRVPVSLDVPPSPAELGKFKLDLYNYSGDDKPVWMRDKQGVLLPKFCIAVGIYVPLDSLCGTVRPRVAWDGILQCQLNFDICMRFGGTELVAYIEWKKQGNVRTGPCTLVPIMNEA
ncbi:unnamed protein product [Rhizoctonia solani]|uniref:Uncharacterized protein n=1 Tax=Rhizoctonia solani TaxID=456999 RepID=A0A8H3EBA1_9AGAM|nr:unnamed protein product [Rhizoctonia solani]